MRAGKEGREKVEGLKGNKTERAGESRVWRACGTSGCGPHEGRRKIKRRSRSLGVLKVQVGKEREKK